MNFLNKYGVKLVFSDAPQLNVSAVDLGENMIALSFSRPPIDRLPTGSGATVASANIFVPVRLAIQVLKTSPADQIYTDAFKNNAVVQGNLLFIDDSGKEWQIQDLSFNLEAFNAAGQEAHRDYVIEGNAVVNQNLLADLGL